MGYSVQYPLAHRVIERSQMIELLRSNDVVLMSFVRSLLGEANIPYTLLDQNMSIMEGSIGVLQQRIMVEDERLAEARTLLGDVDIEYSSNK